MTTIYALREKYGNLKGKKVKTPPGNEYEVVEDDGNFVIVVCTYAQLYSSVAVGAQRTFGPRIVVEEVVTS